MDFRQIIFIISVGILTASAQEDWIPLDTGEVIVKLSDMSSNSTQFKIITKSRLAASDKIAIVFLSSGFEKMGSLTIGPEGLRFEIYCSGELMVDYYQEGVIKPGEWSFQKVSDMLTIRHDGDDFYVLTADDDCLNEEIRAIEFEELADGASVVYSGMVVKGACDPGYTVTTNGACLRCPMATFSSSGTNTACTACPDNKYSYPGSSSERDCLDKVTFDELVSEQVPLTNTTAYNAFWDLEKDVSVVFRIDQTEHSISGCDVMIAFEQVSLEIDISKSNLFKGEVERSLTAVYDQRFAKSITVKDQNVYEISVGFEEGMITVTVPADDGSRTKKIQFERIEPSDLTNPASKTINVAVSDSQCLNFLDSQSEIMLVEPEEPKELTESSTTVESDVETTEATLCEATYYHDCENVILELNVPWAEFEVHSLEISNIPPGRGIKMTADNSKSYVVTDKFTDSNLHDGVSIPGLYMESEGATKLITLEYIEYQKPKVRKYQRTPVNRAPPDLIERDGEVESEFSRNYHIEEEENEEVKELILNDVINFVDLEDEYDEGGINGDGDNDDEKAPKPEKIKVWRPKFNNAKVPVKVFTDKAKKYKKDGDTEAVGNLMGYLAHNGYIDVGVNKNHKKKAEKETGGNKAGSVAGDAVVDEDAMIETVKAFQKFNGFPETGELTEKQTQVLSLPRCGNRDTSYKDEIESFTCIESDGVIESDEMRNPCALDEDSFLDICSHFPNDFVKPGNKKEDINDFVWDKGYYFEADLDFSKSKKRNSHVGIAFNYENSTRTSDYVFVQYEKKNSRLVFTQGTYTRGSRSTVQKLDLDKCVELDKDQKRLKQFKVRVTVGSNVERTASVAVNGLRIFRFNTVMPTKSSVYTFTLGGSNYGQHKVSVFTARICRRNILYEENEGFNLDTDIKDIEDIEDVEGVLSRKKRWSHSNFRWYPNGKPISYAFTNYSTHLGEEKTRKVVEEALQIWSSRGFEFQEIMPVSAEDANIVFMFIRGYHADGMVFQGKALEKGHAFVPVHGEIHFNDFEWFSDEEDSIGENTSLKYVAMHEIGHALGISHSEVKNAVMAKEYPGQNAFSVNELDFDDTAAIRAQYAEIVTKETELLSRNYEEGLYHLDTAYLPRLPVPTDCLNSIEAAFYLYGREGLENSIYMMAHGYVWVFNPDTKEMLPGYPKRLGLVFYGAPAQIDAAFDTGALIHLIAGKRVIIYKVKDGVISYNNENTLEGLFLGITENKIKAAFNNKKVKCGANSDSNCIKTTLVVDTGTEDSKYYEVSWKKRGKTVAKMLGGDGTKVIGSELKNNLFGAAYEYTKSDGTTEVMIFQRLGRTVISRVFFPGVNYEARDSWWDVPSYFSIVGWCV